MSGHGSVSQSCPFAVARLLCPWDFPDKNTWVGCCLLLQKTLPDPGIKSASTALQEILYCGNHQGTQIQLLFSSLIETFFFFFLVLPVYCYQPISLHPRAHAQSCNPMDFSPPDSSVHGFFQARILEWVAMRPFFKKRKSNSTNL